MQLVGAAAALLAGCDARSMPTVPEPVTLATPAPVAFSVERLTPPARAYTATLEPWAHLLITSHVEYPGAVRVRWWRQGAVAWDQTFPVPAGATVRAFPDCFYGGVYRVELVGQGWARTRDFGPTVPFCY